MKPRGAGGRVSNLNGIMVMYLHKIEGPRVVTLPNGETLSRADLPPADTRRWVARRKWLVAVAVQYGLLPAAEARQRYGLSFEELNAWIERANRFGAAGLKVSQVSELRTNSGSDQR